MAPEGGSVSFYSFQARGVKHVRATQPLGNIPNETGELAGHVDAIAAAASRPFSRVLAFYLLNGLFILNLYSFRLGSPHAPDLLFYKRV